MSALISTQTLAAREGEPRLHILDASWHMPVEKRDAKAEYATQHIPGAMFFDIDVISDRTSPYPHMLPTPDAFARSVSELGIADGDEIVIYDTVGIFSAPRVWWMFRVMGHDKVKVLNGGLPKWKAEGLPLSSGEHTVLPGAFHARFRPELLRTMDQVRANITKKHELVVDARSAGRFSGAEPEPRPGLKSGHIEDSANVFFKDCLTPAGTLKDTDELHTLFTRSGVNPKKPLTASCGSGVTACILALALHELGNPDVAIYDGAWAEWGV